MTNQKHYMALRSLALVMVVGLLMALGMFPALADDICPNTGAAHVAGEAQQENYVAATCGADGGYDMVTRCSSCGAVLASDHTTLNATGEHVWDAGVESSPATCVSPAIYTYTCMNNCGATTTASVGEVNPDAHNWVQGEMVSPANCVSGAVYSFTCSLNSGHTKQEAVGGADPDAHNWVQGEMVSPANCVSGAVYSFTCSLNSGHTKQEAVGGADPANHANLAHCEKADATCTTAGNIEYWYCDGCGKYYMKPDESTMQEITQAETVIPAGHVLEKVNEVPATDTAPGAEAYWKCNKCEKMFSDEAGVNEISAPTAIPMLTYTVTWKNGETVLATDEGLALGAKPEYKSETQPAKEADEANTYAFAGWTYEPALDANGGIAGNTTATAQFAATPIAYTVTWKNGETVLATDEGLALGAKPEYKGETQPTKEADAANTYTFTGWTYEPALDENGGIAGNTTATAQFAAAPITCTVTWKNGEEVLETDEGVALGAKPEYNKEALPQKAADAESAYEFTGWAYEPALDENGGIKGSTVATAQFKAVALPKIALFDYAGGTGFMTYKPELTALQELLKLPATVPVTLDNQTKAEVGLIWNYDSYAAQTVDGDYVFTSALAEGSPALAEGVTMPSFTLRIGAATSADGIYTYRLNPAGELTIEKLNAVPQDGNVIVPQLIDGHPVVAVGAGAFSSQATLARLQLPAGVRTIGDGAFANCPALQTLVVPDSVEPLLGKDILLGDPLFANLILSTDLNSTLTAADTVTHNVTVNEVETPVSVQWPAPITDIYVNTNTFTLGCAYTLAAEHTMTVYAGGTLNTTAGMPLVNMGTLDNQGVVNVAATSSVTNFGTVTNTGVVNASGSIVNCAGFWTEGAEPQVLEGGSYVKTHSFEGGKCKVCGAEDPDYVVALTVSYTGSAVGKVYDKTRNVSLKTSEFKLSGVEEGRTVEIGSITAAYDKPDVGDRTVTVSFKLKGADAKRYTVSNMTLQGKITPKELIITPTDGQKKTFGASDPTYLTGKVKGLLSGDTVTGRLAREPGETVGTYKIVQGTIDAGNNYAVNVLDGHFTVEAKSINSSDVGLVTIGNQRYTGEAITPDVSLRFGSRTLVKDTDFKVEYSNNIQPGTATVKLTGMGNYTGQRETTFRILNIANNVTTSTSSSGGSSRSYSYSGFDDGEYESMEDFDDVEEEDEEDEDTGRLILTDNTTGEEVDYGRVLFTAAGRPFPFVQFSEEVESGSWELTIIPDPMEDVETGETQYLESDAGREKFDELHLQLPMSLVEALQQQGYTYIVYEFDKADVRIPLASLSKEISLSDDANPGVVEGVTPVETDENGEPVAQADKEQEIAPEVLEVALYDICLEQVEGLALTERENGLLDDYEPITPSYRLRVSVVSQEDQALAESLPDSLTVANGASDDSANSLLSLAKELPENRYPENIRMLLLPLDDADISGEVDDDEALLASAPKDAVLMYMSYAEQKTDENGAVLPAENDRDVVEMTPAAFTVVDGMLYADVAPRADGIYAVGLPSDGTEEEEEAEEDEEDTEFSDDDFGNNAGGGTSFGMGSSFTVDENGNAVFN